MNGDRGAKCAGSVEGTQVRSEPDGARRRLAETPASGRGDRVTSLVARGRGSLGAAGAGSRPTVGVIVVRSKTNDSRAAAKPGLPPGLERPAGAVPLRVLIVDDNGTARAALAALLSTIRGIQVTGAAESGKEALAFVAEHPVDVVIMDVRMPGMDGIEATRRIKALKPAVCVVVLTVCSAFREEAIEADADRFVVKGGPVDELLDAIRSAHVAPGPGESDAEPGAHARRRTGFASSRANLGAWPQHGHPR